ncbi:MAG: multidrug effflux MFS transporter [Nitratireductor sp.]
MTKSYSFPSTKFLNKQTPPHIFTITLLGALGALNMNIILPSLPAMASYFQVEYSLMQLALSAYLAMTAILQLIISPLSDRYGRRPIILMSFVLFIIASLVSALATSFEVYLISRLLQGAIVTGYALSRAIIRDMVPMNEAASMIGYVTMGMVLVPMVGPSIGGFLQEAYGWQSIHYFTTLLGALAFIILWFDLGETNKQRTTSLTAQFKEYPELLTSRRFWGYTLTALFTSGSFFAYLGGVPLLGEGYFYLTPSRLGIFLASIAIGYCLGNMLSGIYTTKLGNQKMMLAGTTLSTLAITIDLLVMMFYEHKSPILFFAPIIVVGLGHGLSMPSSVSGTVSVRPNLAGSAAGLSGALLVGGGAALSVLAGVLLTQNLSPIPLLVLMLISAILSIFAAIYTSNIENSVAKSAVEEERKNSNTSKVTN